MVFALAAMSGGCSYSYSDGEYGYYDPYHPWDPGPYPDPYPDPYPNPNPGPDIDIYGLVGNWIPSNGSGSGFVEGLTYRGSLNSYPGFVTLADISDVTDVSALVYAVSAITWDFSGNAIGDFSETFHFPHYAWEWARFGKNEFVFEYEGPDRYQIWTVKFTSNTTATVVEETIYFNMYDPYDTYDVYHLTYSLTKER